YVGWLRTSEAASGATPSGALDRGVRGGGSGGRGVEVVFTLLAERYERGSVLMTSNLPFSKWEAIFKDAMMTAAAIDRLVHHSVIIELNIPSYRVEHAKKNQQAESQGEGE